MFSKQVRDRVILFREKNIFFGESIFFSEMSENLQIDVFQ